MRLRSLLDTLRVWPVCLAGAAIAYLTAVGSLLLLAPDIAFLIAHGYPTARLVFVTIVIFFFFNMLITLTYSVSALMLRGMKIVEGLVKNSRKLLKGFFLLSISNFASLIILFLASYYAVLETKAGLFESLGILAMNYGAGITASTLFATSITWLVASLVGGGFWKGWRSFLSTVSISLLMLILLSIYMLPGLFVCSILIPAVISVSTRPHIAEDKGIGKILFQRLRRRSIWRTMAAIILSVIILNAEAPLGPILLVFGEETRFNEDRLKRLICKAVVEGWSSEELVDAIRRDRELSMLSKYDLSGTSIKRDDGGRVVVTIPLSATCYNISRKTRKKTTVYDVYLQSSSGEATVGDRRYVPTGSKVEEKTYGPFNTLDEALKKEAEVKGLANSTRIFWNSTMKTESKIVTKVKPRYAIVPTVIETKYNVIAEYDNYQSACNHGAVIAGAARVRAIEKQVWVESYALELVRETTNCYEAMRMREYGYVVEEVYRIATIYVFSVSARVAMGMGVITWYPVATWEYEKKAFESKLQSREIILGSDGYYYTTVSGTTYRLWKTREEQRKTSEVEKYRIYRRVDASRFETKRVYQVVVPTEREEKKISVGELPSYAKGFEYREDAEKSKPSVEPNLRKWVENEKGLTYKSCQVEPYEETVTRLETATKEVKQYYVSASYVKTLYDVYELKPYRRTWEETRYEEMYGWVFKGYVDEKPESYDTATWVYSPEVSNWTSRIYLGLVTEWEARVLTSIDPRYVAEEQGTTTMTREINYYDVYNATWKLSYHYYKYFLYPFHEYLINGNMSSGKGWFFESIGDAIGEVCCSEYRSSPSSLRIVSGDGRGAWRQSFYFDAGGASPTIDFWYILRGSGALAIKKPDGSAHLLTLEENNGWGRFHRNSTDIFDEEGYYTISFVACEESELFVDDASVHVGGYGKWVYQGDVEECPNEVPPDERYEPFYRIEDKRLIGTFEESVASQYPTPPYIKEFRKKEKVSYTVNLYRLYYLEGGVVRYRVYHWEKYTVPVVIRKKETGAKWVLVERGVEGSVGNRILVESNVPENIVRKKYGDPLKYYLVPRVVDAGEELETICQTFDKSLAEKYEKEGYVVKEAKISVENPIRFEAKVLEATVENDELNMLGKQNLLKILVVNPTNDTLAYQVVLETTNEKRVEEAALSNIPVSVPGATEKIYSYPAAEPCSWLIVVPPNGASFSLPFTLWIRREHEKASVRSENVAYWPGGAVKCNFMIKILRNGRLVAKYSTLETFQNYDLGKIIARHPFEVAQGFAATVGIGVLTILFPQISLPLMAFGLTVSTMVGTMAAFKTGNPMDFLTYGPTGFIVMPIRAFFDPTLDDRARCTAIGALIGFLGITLAREISSQLYLQEAPDEYKPLLRNIEDYYGRGTAVGFAKGLTQLNYYCSNPDSIWTLRNIVVLASKGEIDAREVSLLLDKISSLSPEFLSKHADEIAMSLATRQGRVELSALLSLGSREVDRLAIELHDDFEAVKNAAILKQLGASDGSILYELADGKLNIYVDKDIGSRLFQGIREGQYARFRLVGEKGVTSIVMPYRETVLKANMGFREYYMFTLQESRIVGALSPLGSLKIVPEFTYSLKDIGFFYGGPYGVGSGSAGVGGIRTAGGTYFSQGLRQELVWSSDVGYSGSELNKLALSTSIQGRRVLFIEGMTPLVAYGSNYLPALLVEEESGLRVGELALPSGGSLTVSQSSMASLGIQEGLVNIIYPNGETYATVYAGGSLRVPMLSYSSGAFVGIQKVETRVVWTGSIGQREFYAQIASVSELLESLLGRGSAEELVKTLLLSSLTDSQALDVANEIVRNLEWLKWFSEEELKEIIRRIVEYVKKGDTAEEAFKKVMIEDLEIAILAFSQALSDPELGDMVKSLLRHIRDNAGPDAAAWLLEFLGRNYLRDAYSKGTAYAEERLRETIKKVLKYGESLKQNCAIATRAVKLLMKIRELRDRINRGERGKELANLIGDIGEDYVKLYLEDKIKETVSELTGIPKEELRVEGLFERGPDFHVYHKEGLVAIVEVETTTLSKRYPGGCLDYGRDQLMTYFTKEEWKHLREAKFGIPIAIFLKDLDKMISTMFEEGVEHTEMDMKDIVWNPNYGS